MEEEVEHIECSWCQLVLVPKEEGYCSKKCQENDKKANEE